ncbi:MAG: MFS transporter, partial [Myxococcota bacterium]
DPLALAAVLTSLAAFAGLSVHQRRVDAPFLPRALLANAPYRRIVAMGFLTTGSNLAALIGLPLLLTRFDGVSAFEVGLVLAPGAIMTAVCGVAAGRLVDRYGARMPTFVGASLIVVVMLGLSLAAGRSLVAVVALAGVLGGAYSLVNTPLAATITTLVRPTLLASALSMNIMVFFVGGSFGTTLFVALTQLDGAAWIPGYPGPAASFSNAFALFTVPMLVTAGLALTLPRRRQPTPSLSRETAAAH